MNISNILLKTVKIATPPYSSFINSQISHSQFSPIQFSPIKDQNKLMAVSQIRTFNNPCKRGKGPMREPCAPVCEEEDEDNEKKKKVSPKCEGLCDEFRKKKDQITYKTICDDLKCLTPDRCGLENNKIPEDCCIPDKVPECVEEEEEDPCPEPPSCRYKSLDPCTYLNLPEVKCPKKFCKPCSLLPPVVPVKSCKFPDPKLCKPEVGECRLRPYGPFKTGDPSCADSKCQGSQCKPCRLVKKKHSKDDCPEDEDCK